MQNQNVYSKIKTFIAYIHMLLFSLSIVFYKKTYCTRMSADFCGVVSFCSAFISSRPQQRRRRNAPYPYTKNTYTILLKLYSHSMHCTATKMYNFFSAASPFCLPSLHSYAHRCRQTHKCG